jgi:hypothetical protein
MVVTFASDAGENGRYVHLLTVIKVGIPAELVFLTYVSRPSSTASYRYFIFLFRSFVYSVARDCDNGKVDRKVNFMKYQYYYSQVMLFFCITCTAMLFKTILNK